MSASRGAQRAMPVYLFPGEVHCAPEPAIVTTILGSCVAVCLWDAALHVGGINHFVLPEARRGQSDARYGDIAIETLMGSLSGLGGEPRHWRAKVFGGAAVLPLDGRDDTVGRRNVALALDTLRRHRVPVLARSTGGRHGRMIRLHTETGAVDLRRFGFEAASPPGAAGPGLAVLEGALGDA